MLLQGRQDPPPPDFNHAFLLCLPKKVAEADPSGLEVYEASGTLPLSIADASNRIIANIFRVVLERHAVHWVSSYQRGFLPDRSMLRNVWDIDFAAQKNARSPRGAVIKIARMIRWRSAIAALTLTR